MKLLGKLKFAAIAVTFGGALAACSAVSSDAKPDMDSASSGVARVINNGPAADYPVTVGDPFTVDGVVYTPLDTLNYDEVGYAAMSPGGTGVTAGHKTLPFPSYVEVTALDSGRTALIRVERRGPMDNSRLISLSPMAAAQLGVAEGAPVRVRRVNPPEDQRAELRSGHEAPLRMETPPGLLDVLKRKLPSVSSAPLPPSLPTVTPVDKPATGTVAVIDPSASELSPEQSDTEASPALPQPLPSGSTQPVVDVPNAHAPDTHINEAPAITLAPQKGEFVIQIGAFSVRANADRLAKRVDGHVVERGQLTLVRVGPFESRGQAEQALAKLRSEGYSDARIESVR